MMPFNAFSQRFGGPVMQPGGPIQMQMPGGMPGMPPINTVGGAPPPGAVQPVSQPAPSPAPVGNPMMNAYARFLMPQPQSGVRNMMPPVMPPASSGNMVNAFRTRMGLQL